MIDNIKKHQNLLTWIFLVLYLLGGLWFTVSVTSLYSVMGDDTMNLTMWYEHSKNGGFWYWTLNDIKSNLQRLIPVSGQRYFPLFLQSTWVLSQVAGSVSAYRTYLAVNTFVDILVFAFLTYRVEPKSDLWKVQLIISPFMLNLFGFSDGNALFSYHAFVQRTFLIMLIALHLQISFIRSQIRWHKVVFAILCVIISMAACLNYELGYLNIFPAIVLSLYEPTEKTTKSLIKRLTWVMPCFLGIFAAFLLYLQSGGSDSSYDTTINLQVAFIALETLRQLSSGMPISVSLLSDLWIHPSMIKVEDVVFPLVGGGLVLLFFMLPVSLPDPKKYWGGMVLGIVIAVPAAVLISLTEKFQNEKISPAWAGWTGGWITSLLCTFGFILIVATFIMALRHYEMYISAGLFRRTFIGLLLAVVFVISSVYGHGVSRVYCKNGAYIYDLIRQSLIDGGLEDAPEEVSVVSNINVRGFDTDEQRHFFETYSGHSVKYAGISGMEKPYEVQPEWAYSLQSSGLQEPKANERYNPGYDNGQYIIISGAYEKDGSYQLNRPRVYVDTKKMESNMMLHYEYASDDGYKTDNISKDELEDIVGRDEKGFVRIDHDHVITDAVWIYSDK